MAYATVFGCAFTSGLLQKTTSGQRGTTYPADRSAGSMAYATVFGCYFTSGVYYKLYSFLHVVSSSFGKKESSTYIHRRGRVQSCTMNILTFNLREVNLFRK